MSGVSFFYLVTGFVLARPGHFTFSTNHGVMQNLALWHLGLAFPTLPDAARYRDTAFTRLKQQMAFYMNREGVVLEHSTGYHRWGVEFLGMAMRYLALTGTPAPADWVEKYDRAKAFYAQVRRPDGSLPPVGDTDDKPDAIGPMTVEIGPDGRSSGLRREPAWRPRKPDGLYPAAGYSVWWDGLERWPDPRALTQTVVAWSRFPGHGHKHADEPSVSLWAAGELWWSNTGYWAWRTGCSIRAPSVASAPIRMVSARAWISASPGMRLTLTTAGGRLPRCGWRRCTIRSVPPARTAARGSAARSRHASSSVAGR